MTSLLISLVALAISVFAFIDARKYRKERRKELEQARDSAKKQLKEKRYSVNPHTFELRDNHEKRQN